MSVQSLLRRVSATAVVLALLLLPIGSAAAKVNLDDAGVKADITGGAPTIRSWHTIMTQSFEGLFPPDCDYGEPCWGTVGDVHGDDALTELWDDVSTRAFAGYWSAHPAPYQNPYPAGMHTDLGYGPFSLVGVLNARVKFTYWLDTDDYFDFFSYGYSCNGGLTWKDTSTSASTTGWKAVTMSLKPCRGKAYVEVRWSFSSSSAIGRHPGWSHEGPYVDNVRLQTYY